LEIAKLRVHIAPVGYEIDRIVIPAKNLKADVVYLLIHNKPSEDKAVPFIAKIEKLLKKENIKVERKKHDRLDIFDIIKSVKEIIQEESKNDIYVNLASGSKIQAIATMMATMMFNGKQNVQPFYTEAVKYAGYEGNQLSTGVKKLFSVPTYEVHTPKPELIKALKLINARKDGKIQKKEMISIAVDNKLITVKDDARYEETSKHASLDKNILEPLLKKWKFIEIEKIGRTRLIKITEEGKNAIKFL